ncbi:MAG: hypothetical protein ACRDJX_02580 [Solirubrobacteraceae bacterium]
MLSSFGMFWGAEGAGAAWPGGEGALLVSIDVTAWWVTPLAVLVLLALSLRRGLHLR